MAFELSSVRDFARLVCAFEHVPQPVFAFKEEGLWNLFIQYQADVKKVDYIFVASEKVGHYLGYRNVYGVETVDFFTTVHNASYIYAPIVFLKRPPSDWFKSRIFPFKRSSFVELEDLGSLVRVATYKMLYEESVLPLFYVNGDQSVLFTILSYGEGLPTKVYYVRTEAVEKNFIKYSSERNLLEYTDNVDESGFVYVKIIRVKRLAEKGNVWPSLKG